MRLPKMKRDRPYNRYEDYLGIDILGLIREHIDRDNTDVPFVWIDMFCGNGVALTTAFNACKKEFGSSIDEVVRFIGIDKYEIASPPQSPGLLYHEHVDCVPYVSPIPADLITCVFGLQYVPDKLETVSHWYDTSLKEQGTLAFNLFPGFLSTTIDGEKRLLQDFFPGRVQRTLDGQDSYTLERTSSDSLGLSVQQSGVSNKGCLAGATITHYDCIA
jgi:hypothetical protein